MGVEQDQLPCGSTGTSCGDCQEMEMCMVWTCYMPQQLLHSHPSGHLGGWAMPWAAEEMLAGQHRRVDIPRPLAERLQEDLCLIISNVPRMTQSVMGLNWTELNWWWLKKKVVFREGWSLIRMAFCQGFRCNSFQFCNKQSETGLPVSLPKENQDMQKVK